MSMVSAPTANAISLLLARLLQLGQPLAELLVDVAELRRRQGGPAAFEAAGLVLGAGHDAAGVLVFQVAAALLRRGQLLLVLGRLLLEHRLVILEEFAILFL